MHHRYAGKVLPQADRLDRTRHGRMYISRYEACRLPYHLSSPDPVPGSDYSLGRSAEMLGHGYVHGLWNRQALYPAACRYFLVIGMHPTY